MNRKEDRRSRGRKSNVHSELLRVLTNPRVMPCLEDVDFTGVHIKGRNNQATDCVRKPLLAENLSERSTECL